MKINKESQLMALKLYLPYRKSDITIDPYYVIYDPKLFIKKFRISDFYGSTIFPLGVRDITFIPNDFSDSVFISIYEELKSNCIFPHVDLFRMFFYR